MRRLLPLRVRCAAVLSFRPSISPFKVVVLPLDSRTPRAPCVDISASLAAVGLSSTVDDSGASIGKRYSRVDEIGVPFCVTFDFESETAKTVTIRERDTCAQIRVPIADLTTVLRTLADEVRPWSDYMAIYPVVTTGEDKAASAGGGAGVVAAPIVHHTAGALAPAPASAGAGSSSAAVPVVGAAHAASRASAGTVGVKLEGGERSCGRFNRPKDL